MPRALPVALLVAALAAGCGSGGDPSGGADPAPRADRPPPAEPAPAPRPEEPSGLPRGVPTIPDGPVPAGAERVVRDWLAAVRASDFDRAARLFAPGARVQNGGPVVRLTSRAGAAAWNEALPCGAKLTEIRGSGGYALVAFELVDRPGASCGSGKGAAAYGAIRVRDGRITDWFRLPDPLRPPQDDDPSGAPIV